MYKTATVTLQTRVPVQLLEEMQALISTGWYVDENDLLMDALRRFLGTHAADVMERQLCEDVQWGLYGVA